MPQKSSTSGGYNTASLVIIFINLFAFVFIYFSPNATRQLVESMVLTPANLARGNYLCLFTSGFLHANLLHLSLNMLGVFVFGRVVERHLGTAKTLFIYGGSLLISAVFSAITYYFLMGEVFGIVGASGAVMGLLAAAMLLEPFGVTYELLLPIPLMVKGWIYLYSDLQGFLTNAKDGISHLSHLFGFFSIMILVYFLSGKDKKELTQGLITNVISLAVFLILWRYLYILKHT